MPNHVHMILIVTESGGPPGASAPTEKTLNEYTQQNPPCRETWGMIVLWGFAYFAPCLRSFGTITTMAAPDRSRNAAHRPIWLSSPVLGEEDACAVERM